MRYQAYIVCFTTDTADICMEPRASRRAAVADAETLFAQYGGDYRAVVVDLEQRANGWREEAVIYSIAAGEEIDEAPAAAPRCATCAGEGDCPDCGTLEAAEPTPGAWHIIEVRPAGDEPSTCGGLWLRVRRAGGVSLQGLRRFLVLRVSSCKLPHYHLTQGPARLIPGALNNHPVNALIIKAQRQRYRVNGALGAVVNIGTHPRAIR